MYQILFNPAGTKDQLLLTTEGEEVSWTRLGKLEFFANSFSREGQQAEVWVGHRLPGNDPSGCGFWLKRGATHKVSRYENLLGEPTVYGRLEYANKE